jgi:iron complex transport system ATP-binding protein
MSGGPVLAIEKVSFAYARRPPVLSDVSLEVPAGARLALLGPNGAGKSTLVRLLARILRPSSGRVLLDGRDLGSFTARELARRIAVVPQETALDFPFSVTEVVLMGRSPHLGGLGFEGERDLEVAARVMAQAGVTELGDRLFHELSGGEKQRVVIARALAQEPRILLLDEPATFLDLKHVTEIFDLLLELSTSERITLVIVLHDLNLAALYCDRVAFLRGGRILAAGPTDQTLDYMNIKETYETDVYVTVNDLSGRLNVLPLARGKVER